jgi:predicted metal-binding transcription factor (methanogenesis marker protein 9)
VDDTSQLLLNNHGQPDILYTQLNKYSTVFTPIDGLHEELDDMAEQLINLFKSNMRNDDLTRMTEQEALSGRPDYPDSKPLDMTTTSGEPWSKVGFSGGKKKNSYCKIERDPETGRKLYTINTEQQHGADLKYVIEHKERLLHKGTRTLSLWKNCLKDETRPIAKARVGKTRLFTAVPMDTAILSRIFFGKFKEVWQTKRTSLFHSVGINPVSLEWTTLANYMSSRGDDFYDADFGAYDGRLRPEFMETAGKIVITTICEVNGDYSDELAMTTLWDEYIRTHQISGRDVHIVKHGNPSGNPMTTVINCIVNLLYHWWCYIKITNNTDLNSFNRDIAFTCFGDDVIYSTNSNLTGYSFENVAKYMKVLEQDYTVASKDLTAERTAKTLEEITFLKRHFVQCYDIYLAPIDPESIEQQFNYTNISPKDYERIRVQLDEALLEAAALGKNYYEVFVSAISDNISRDLLLAGTIGINFQRFSKACECLIDRIYNS